jgi:hypothetical protein
MKLLKFPLPHSIYCGDSYHAGNWQQVGHIINTKLRNIQNWITVAYAELFRSHALLSPSTQPDQLNKLLDQAHMVICPVDCISHEDFFLVKNYCALTGKICTFLARSTLLNFQQGLKMLINLSRNNLGLATQ